MTSTPVFTQTPLTAAATQTSGSAWTPSGSTTTNLIKILTAGSNGARVTSLIAATTDTAANNLFIVIDAGGNGGNLGIAGQVNVPVTAGTAAGTAATDLLNSATTPGLPVDNNGKNFIHLQANDVLYIGLVTGMTSGKTLFITAQYENY